MKTKMPSAVEKITLNAATFSGDVVTPTFINFFYGRNGAGKTTIAQAIKDNDSLQWQQGKTDADYDVLVYDQDFISSNFQNYGNLSGVFTVCEANIEIQNQVAVKSARKDELGRDYREATETAGKKTEAKASALTRFQGTCWDSSKVLRDRFDAAFKGKKRKEALADHVLTIKKPVEHDMTALQTLYDIAFSADSRTYREFSKAGAVTYGKLPGRELMGKTVVSSSETPFASFIKALQATDWVRQGHSHYAGQTDGKCPYCQQKLPANFEKEISACFDAQYQQDVSDIAKFQQVYESEMQAILDRLNANMSDTLPALDLSDYKAKLALLESSITINLQRIAAKIKEPTTIAALEDTDTILIEIGGLIDDINKAIKANNDVVNAKQTKQTECVDSVWEHLAFLLKDDVASYTTGIAALQAEIDDLNKKAKAMLTEGRALAGEISDLNKQVVNTKAAIDGINALLHDSGFQGFSLREKAGAPNTYEVIRPDGSVAEKLSEGERNFIAFLYFYHLVRGSHTSDATKDKIVVIDDPVSSMDSGALFIVSALVREMVEVCYNNTNYLDHKVEGDYIKQIFILTHNVYFHREITYHQVGRYQIVSFFIIRKTDNVSSVTLCERQSSKVPTEKENYNPVQNSYAALWGELREVDSPITVLNVVRRILEYYFLQLCGYEGTDIRKIVLEDNKDKFVVQVEGEQPDYSRYHLAASMLSYINNPTGISDGLNYVEDCVDAEQYKTVFKLIFESLHQEQHYKMMMGQD